MSSQLTHERCSELLAAYLSGELDPDQHRLVEDHLEHCAQCSAEVAGLVALRSAADEGLTGDERAMLRAGVLGTIRDPGTTSPLQDESDAVVVPLGRRGARAGKYLGIAAMLALLAVGSLFVLGGGGLGMSGSDDGGADSAGGQAEDSDEAGGGAEDEPTEAAGGEDAFRLKAGNVRPDFQSDRGTISESDLDSFGQRAALAYSRSSEASTADTQPESEGNLLSDQAPEALQRLVARAPEPLTEDVTECGQTALGELDPPGLATYATTATIEGEDIIVIAFVTGDRSPDRYAVFAFPRGDCTTILTSTEGPIE